MPKTCLTCLSHDDLLDLSKRDWKVLEYLIYPSKKSLSGILKANKDAGICSKCQRSMICIDEFRTSAMGNFVKLMETWEKVKGIHQGLSGQMTPNLHDKRVKELQTDQVEIKLEPFVSEDLPVKKEHMSFDDDIQLEHVFTKEGPINDDIDDDDDDDIDTGNKDGISNVQVKNPILFNMLQNMYVMNVSTNSSIYQVLTHVPKNIESELYSDEVKEQTQIFSGIPDAKLNTIDKEDAVQLNSKAVDNTIGRKNKELSVLSESVKSTGRPDELLNTNIQPITSPSIPPGPKKYQCKYCDKPYVSASGLYIHVQVKHSNLQPVTCTVCNKTLQNEISLKKHMKSHVVKKKDLHCDICDRWYSKGTFKQHFKESVKHRGDGDAIRVQCNYCNKTYSHKSTLKYHIEAMHLATSEQQYCPPCDKWFNSQSYKTHLKYSLKHIGEDKQRFICNYCNKKFLQKNYLEYHIKVVHLKIKPYKCPQCPRAFSRRDPLNKHIRHDHENIPVPKNHICEVCGRAFRNGFLLRKHMPVHTGERPYKCGKCDATFGHSAALFLHNRYKHEKKKCPPKKKKIAANTKKVN